MGWAGLKQAFASCLEGGSVLVKEGEYAYGPGDMERQVDEKGSEYFAALPLSCPLHLFGQGKAVFRPVNSPPFSDWGYTKPYCVLSTSPRGTLDGLSIEAPRGTNRGHFTHGVGIWGGGMRLQSCIISAPNESRGVAVFVQGPSSKPAVVGCQLSGGKDTVWWSCGALGRLVGCQISGATEIGLVVFGTSTAPISTAPIVASNTFRDSGWGISIGRDVDDAWAPGEGNTFENIEEGDVEDERGGEEEEAEAY